MKMVEHLRLLAHYNQWMNERLFRTAAGLDAGQLAADRGAFFGSILGTLNHLMVGDVIWLKRFATHPAKHASLDSLRTTEMPKPLDQILFGEMGQLGEERARLDEMIRAWTEELTNVDLDHMLDYRNTKGVRSIKRFGSLALHLFNHQTHHRGQVTTLLSQQGLDMGVTDLLVLIPDALEA